MLEATVTRLRKNVPHGVDFLRLTRAAYISFSELMRNTAIALHQECDRQ
jgi:hypothetical protein